MECVPLERLSHVTEQDTLGFSRSFADFGFSFVLRPIAADRTLVRLEGYYRPRGPVSRLLNALVLRRRLDGVRRTVLENLKRLVESAGEAEGAVQAA